MQIEHLKLENFRLVQSALIDLAPGANLIVGENAQGKTTILEAIGVLATGRSFRAARDRECIHHDDVQTDEFAAAECDFFANGVQHNVRTAITTKTKVCWVDGAQLARLGDMWGLLNAVVFLPSDLELVQGSPTLRRALLGSLIARVNKLDLQAMKDYAAALRDRNALLRSQRAINPQEFEVFEEGMARSAARLVVSRQLMLERLSPYVNRQVREMTSGADNFAVEHEIGWPKGVGIRREWLVDDPKALRDLADKFQYFFARDREADIHRGQTEHGPHRGDIVFQLNGRDARTFASQGQSRTIVVALRLAEIELLTELCGDAPVLLLDDVLGELDQARTSYFVQMLASRQIQSVLTATDAKTIENQMKLGARFRVKQGKVTRE